MATMRITSRALVLGVVIAMLLVPISAMATHNSVGGHISVAQADEVTVGEDGGELLPDIDPDGELRTAWHTNLATPRLDPVDQRGERYTECDTPGDVGEEAYLAGLTAEGNSCYVGFIDHQLEYRLANNQLLFRQGSDLLYPVNPDPNDEDCQDPVARLTPDCAGAGHNQFIPGNVIVDTDLLEAPTQGAAGLPGAGELTTPNEGSGYNTLPFLLTPYIFLFGQPHPDTVEAGNASAFQAGSGPFGPNPAEGGNPLFDITGACGDRTLECTLLTPEDIINYDSNNQNLKDAGVTNEGTQARVCAFLPQFQILNPDERDAGLCGVFASVVNQYVDTDAEGGLGLPTGTATWIATQPGWYQGVQIITAGELSRFGGTAQTVDKYQCAAEDPTATLPHLKASDCDGELPPGVITQVAVNPAVPTQDHALWCVRPNMLAVGDDTVAGVNDPGLYGAYKADAIDADVFRPVLNNQNQMVLDATHDTVRGALGPVEDTVADAGSTVNDAIEDADLPPEVADALDRAQPLESGEPVNQAQPFAITQEEGIRCDALGLVQAQDEDLTIDGDLVFDVGVSQATVNLKDPTLMTDGLPAGESETTDGVWQTDQYSFSGNIIGFLDTSQDAVGGDDQADFSGCATANGQPQPDSDFCAWRAIWDAYNPECTNIAGDTCEEILENRNYDLDAGVGLYFVATFGGPVVVTDEDLTANAPPRPNEITSRTAVVGLGDPTAQNCIVGFSFGLAERIDSEAIVEAACQESDGETFVIEDAFDDESGVTPGGFSAAVEFTKLTPTPTAVVDNTGIGEGDGLCLTGLFSVNADSVATDTQNLGDLTLTGGTAGTTHEFVDCVAFESTVEA